MCCEVGVGAQSVAKVFGDAIADGRRGGGDGSDVVEADLDKVLHKCSGGRARSTIASTPHMVSVVAREEGNARSETWGWGEEEEGGGVRLV